MLRKELLRRVSRLAMSGVVAAALLAGCESMTVSLGKKIGYIDKEGKYFWDPKE